MISLLLLVFLLQLAIHLINTLGASAIHEFIWRIWSYVPSEHSGTDKSFLALKSEVVQLRADLKATSAQDEFAKWAKIQRQLDKKMVEYEKRSGEVKAYKASIEKRITMLRWTCTTGLRFFLQFWHSKTPMFWLPRGWAPYYAEWIVSFPRAPLGSVSIQVWGAACATAISVVSELVVYGYEVSTQTERGQSGKTDRQRQKVKIPAQGVGGMGEKKEL